MSMRGRLIVGVAAACAIGAAGYSMFRTRPSRLAEVTRISEAWAADLRDAGQKVYAPLATASVSDLAAPGAFRSLLHVAHVQQPPPTNAGSLDDALDHVAEFAVNYFCATSPESYREWRRLSGYELVPLARLDAEYLAGQTHEAIFGEPLPSGATSESVFDVWWRHEQSAEVLCGRVARVVIDPRGAIVCGGVRSRVAPGLTPFDGGPQGFASDVWQGSVFSGISPWYGSRGLGHDRLLMVEESVSYVDVGFIVEHTSGYKIPIRVGCVWNPRTNQWSIEHLVYLNYPSGSGAMTSKVF